jgi:gas vesicle protein
VNEHESWKAFSVGLIAGAVLGAALGILYAPQSGRETRSLIKEKAEHAKERAEEIISNARQKAEEIIDTAKKKASEDTIK